MDDQPITVDVRVIPRARHDEIAGERAGRLLVRTTAPPVDSKANEAVRRLLAAHFGVSLGAVDLVRGATSRDKTFRIKTNFGREMSLSDISRPKVEGTDGESSGATTRRGRA